jgi:hypothetical protein
VTNARLASCGLELALKLTAIDRKVVADVHMTDLAKGHPEYDIDSAELVKGIYFDNMGLAELIPCAYSSDRGQRFHSDGGQFCSCLGGSAVDVLNDGVIVPQVSAIAVEQARVIHVATGQVGNRCRRLLRLFGSGAVLSTVAGVACDERTPRWARRVH